MALLEINNLTMRFGGLTAVKGVDCRVDDGQIFSVIGPNGAGKTTVFNAITGIYEPTEGTIRFAGHELLRPLTWKVYLGCALVGLLTGLATLLFSVDVDALWRATINRNMADPERPFSYTEAIGSLKGYLRGELTLRRERSGRWSVIPPWAKSGPPLDQAATRAEAEAKIPAAQEAINVARAGGQPIEQAGKWVLLSADKTRALQTYPAEPIARERVDALAEIGHEQRAMPRTVALALVVGLALGSAGTFAVWRRARRTPDVISLGGIARTFQNIRLFHNMTVIENVLVGMDRGLEKTQWQTVFRLPAACAKERAALGRAHELLQFVGLDESSDLLARQLAYGDQRRLEIARALATEPKLLLLDEPAAGMNPSEAGELMQLIRQIRARGITVMLIEHHMKVVMGISDRIAVLEYGRKIAEGTPAEVRCDPKVIEAYLGKECL